MRLDALARHEESTRVLEQCLLAVLARTYIICKLDPDLRHTDEGFVEVLDSTQGVLRCPEAYIAYASSGEKFGVGDSVSSSEVVLEVLVCDCWRKTADEYTRHCSLHDWKTIRKEVEGRCYRKIARVDLLKEISRCSAAAKSLTCQNRRSRTSCRTCGGQCV